MERVRHAMALVLVAPLLLAQPLQPALAQAAHPEATPAPAPPPPPPKPKARPKRLDKEKYCGWERDADLTIDGKPLLIQQSSLKNVMHGGESEQDGYILFADPDRLQLRVKAPDGQWYSASMTRLGDMNEGCVFFFLGEAVQMQGEPSLY